MSEPISHNSITLCVQKLRNGDEEAAQRLWESYFHRLVRLARGRLERRAPLVGDEEDVALSAIMSFCRGMERGRFPQLNDRNDLWNVLVTITLHKVLHLMRDEGRLKRGGGRLVLGSSAAGSDADLLQQVLGSEPTPEVSAQVAEQAEILLKQLPSQELVDLALMKMEGYTNGEMAQRLQKTERTVERKLNLIRKIWTESATE